MNYQEIQVGDKTLFIDLDKRRSACRDCQKLIHFAQDESGKFYAVNQLIQITKLVRGEKYAWSLHTKTCTGRKTDEEKDRNELRRGMEGYGLEEY